MSHAFIDTKGDYMLELHDEILIEANAVAQLERERIINLLEADCKDGIGDNLQGCFHEVAINLIKGEQK